MPIDIKLPELGEGIETGDVLEVLVSEGDSIEENQGIIELETDKATVEVPSTRAGVVAKVHVAGGQSVAVGDVLISLNESQSEQPSEPLKDADENGRQATVEQKPPDEKVSAQQAEAEAASAESDEQEDAQEARAESPKRQKPHAVKSPAAGETAVPAGPAIRRFAREVGVDLARVTGTGEGGRITRDDVLEVVRRGTARGGGEGGGERDEWGPIRVEKMRRIRRTIADKMHQSWQTAARVTNFDDADVTDLEAFRQSSKADYASKGIKLTSLPFVIKSIAMALKLNPILNASIDVESGAVIYKEYVNVGVAVDTDRGLVVPALRGVDELAINEIALGVAKIAEKVRDGDFTVDDLRGGTFTISNLGSIGGQYSTPIINVPEVAILLVGRSRKRPVVVGDAVAPRLMMPLSLSYDHRLVDGAAAARFLNDVIGYLQAPSRLLLAP